jgi:tetratricopeptide (TPR) repeat protein
MSHGSPPRGFWKGALLRAGLVLLGLTPLLLLEAGLRLFWAPGGAFNPPVVALTTIDPFERSGDSIVTKKPFLPAMRPSRFAARKPAGELRIFCLGGSVTFGYPYDASLAWPSLLRQRLREVYPEVDTEVINLGGNSYGSTRNLATFRAALAYGPDVAVFLNGGTEFVEDSFDAAVAAGAAPASRLRSLRVFQLLERLLSPLRPAPPPPAPGKPGGGDDFFFSPVLSGETYTVTPARRRQVLARLEDNLEQMAQLARERGVPLVLCTAPSNLADWPPQTDNAGPADPAAARRWRAVLDRGRGLERSGALADAAAAYAQAAALWDESAELCFRRGHVLLALGRPDEAVPLLRRARDLDSAPLRASTEINDAIRATARRHGLPLVDLERTFEAQSPGGATGDALVIDFAHPSPRGSALIAREVWRALARLGAPWSPYRAEREAASTAREEAVAARIPPLDAGVAFAWGQIFGHKGMPAQAMAMYRTAIDQGYALPYARQNLAVLLLNEGRPDLALPILEELEARWPDFKEAPPVLARVHQALGNSEEAARQFARTLEAGTPDVDSFRLYALLLLDLQKPAEAVVVLERGLAAHPGDCELESARGLALDARGDWSGARSSLEGTLRRDPGCHPASQNLGALQMKRGELGAAVTTFRRALEQPEPWPEHHLNLGYAYRALGRPGDADVEFAAYCAAVPDCAGRVPPEYLGAGRPPIGEGRR